MVSIPFSFVQTNLWCFPLIIMKQEPSLEGNSGLYKRSKENPFAEGFFTDPIGKLNIRETSEFMKALPMPNNEGAESSGGFMTKRNNVEAPCTPGRPIFSFSSSSSSVGNLSRSRKHFPSKWDDAEKWLIGSSSPAHHPALKPSPESSKVYKRCINNGFKPQQAQVFDQNSSVVVTEEKVSSLQGHNPLDSTDVLLTGKKTFPKYQSVWIFFNISLFLFVSLNSQLFDNASCLHNIPSSSSLFEQHNVPRWYPLFILNDRI